MEPNKANTPNVNPSGPSLPGDESPIEPIVSGQTISPDAPTVPSAPAPVSEIPTADLPTTSSSGTEVNPATPLPLGAPKHRRKGLVVGLIVAVTLLILGGGAGAAYYYTANKPDNVLKTALGNLFNKDKAKSAAFDGSLNIKDEASNFSLEAKFQGQGDSETGAFALSADADVLITKMNLEARSTDGKTFYFKVGGLAGLPELLAASTEDSTMQAYSAIIKAIDNQWFEVNESFINQLGGGIKRATLSEADLKKLAEAYEKNPFLTVKEALSDESIKGTASYHYRVAVDPNKLKAFAAAVKSANLEAIKFTTDEQLKEFNKGVDEADFSKYPFEVWIGKNDKMIHQVSFKISEDGATGELRLTINSYNQPVKVEKPEGAKSILEILGELSGGLGGDTPDTMFDDSSISL